MKVQDARSAAALIPDGATILVDGSGGGVNEPGAVLQAIEQRFLSEGSPCNLTLVHVSGMGDAHGGGIDRFAHDGMVRRVIGGHWGWTPEMQRLAVEEKIEAYCLPQGTLSHLLRDIAARRPGAISAVGIGTFVDPRIDGGRLNESAQDHIVELVTLHGQDYIFTPSFPIDVAIIRGTTADTRGNITMEREGLLAETLSAAQAAKNSGGIVIAQVRSTVDAFSLDPREVKVPGVLIDALVVDPEQRLSFETDDDDVLTGALRDDQATFEPMPLSLRKVIARRAAMEVREGDVINLGFGMPDGVAAVLAEEGHNKSVTFTLEQGHIGGIPAGGANFGLCVNPEASIDAGHQFDWYDGGGLDVTILSFAEIGPTGDVNVSRFGGRIPGVGGFINISRGARRIVFVGTFEAGARLSLPALATEDAVNTSSPLVIHSPGTPKFVSKVQQISFSAGQALKEGRSVTYVTERAVFRLTVAGIELIEVAPGLDVEKDVVDRMSFTPLLSTTLATMPTSIFQTPALGLVMTPGETS